VLIQGQALNGSKTKEGALSSINGQSHLVDQESDGNLVLYIMQGPHGEKPVWSTGTHTTGFKTLLELNYAGELILTRIAGGSTVWRSGVTGNGANFWAQMQDNGNFVVHEGGCYDNSTKVIWATNTTQSATRQGHLC
jgi:hypothetical protein